MDKPAPYFLIVDDDTQFTEILARALTRAGYAPLQAHNQQQMETLLNTHSPTHAVVDLKLGAENGLQIIQRIHHLSPGTSIVMLTGYSSIATAVEAVKLGAMNYLCKPVTLEELLAAFEPGESLPQPVSPPSVERLEWEHIQKVLTENNDNVSATARALGMHRRTLQRKLSKRPVPQ